jgi:hypothetical protein
MYTEDILLGLRGTIAVVGNADISKKEQIIDSFDNVVRFNGFKLAGYEEHVGTQTTLWCTYGENHEMVPWRTEWPAVSPFTRDSEESYQRASFPDLIYTRTRQSVFRQVPIPTTGGLFVSLCAHLKLKVTIFGFDAFKSTHYYKDYHPDCNAAVLKRHYRAREELEKIQALPLVTIG